MTLEGRITIELFPRATRGAVKIVSSRPLSITRRFSGHRPEQIVQTISLLFAACKAAQSIAAAEAFEDALGLSPPESAVKVRPLLILAETAREHALRILMDWPQFLRIRDNDAPAAELRRLMQIDRDLSRALDENGAAARFGVACVCRKDSVVMGVAALKALLERTIFGEDLERFSARATSEDLVQWADAGQTPPQRLLHQIIGENLFGEGAAEICALPQLERGFLVQRLFGDDAEAFVAQPLWDGSPRETSPLAKNIGHPLVAAMRSEEGYGLGARLAACLAELAQTLQQMMTRTAALDDDARPEPHLLERGNASGIGIAQIEAARGRLVHAVRMDGEKTGSYRILAPTEWNFHPDGAASHGLERIARSGRADCAALARLFVTAVDPCVGTDVRVR